MNPSHTPMRVALIGLGESASRIHLPALNGLPEAALIAACDLDPGRRKRAKKRWQIPDVYADPLDMLDQVETAPSGRPDIVVIATPPGTHYQLCKAALERGCHVFCEKPFTPSLEEADQIIALSKSKNRLVAVNHQYDQMPIFRAVTEALRGRMSSIRDSIGRLYHIEAWQHIYLLPSEEAGWKGALAPRRVLFEFGTHVVDLMCQFFDAYPTAVTAQTAEVRPGETADVCVVMRLDFPGKRFGNLVFNRMSYAPIKYLEMRLDGEDAALRASYGGVARIGLDWNSELGRPRFRFSMTKGGELRLEKRHGRSKRLVTQPETALSLATQRHFAQFIKAIKFGGEPRTSAECARDALRVVFAGYQSIEEGGGLIVL
ncbi:MAG: Gfo/Idh/MocA family protein [Anaerolineales bacterium]